LTSSIIPRSTPSYTISPRIRSFWVGRRRRSIVARIIPAKFPYVAVHIEYPKSVGFFGSYYMSRRRAVAFIPDAISDIGIYFVTAVPISGSYPFVPGGVFPLCFRRKPVSRRVPSHVGVGYIDRPGFVNGSQSGIGIV